MSELLPCPFCGSKWTQVRWIGFTHTHNGAYSAGYRGECTDCYSMSRAFETEEEAIAAWNTRAERTCKFDCMTTGERLDYWEAQEHILHCYGCGYEFGLVEYNEDGDVWMAKGSRYCPYCGAKVVEE